MKKLLFALLLACPAWATPTINGTPVSGTTTGSNTISLSVTVAPGSNRLAIVTVYAVYTGGGAVGTGTSVVFNTTENAVFIGGSYGAYTAVEQWYLKMPSVTTANVVVTWTHPTDVLSFVGVGVVVLDGAMQTGTPHRTQACQGDEVGTTQPDLNVDAVSGDLSIDGIVTWLDAITDPDMGQTERIDNASGTDMGINASTETATDTVTEMGWTKSGMDNYSQYCGVSIISASSGVPNGLMLLGVGQ